MRGVPLSALAEAAVRLVRCLPGIPRRRLRLLLAEDGGRPRISPDERRIALGADAGLRRLGVGCLRRSVVVTEMLRRRGVAARMRLSVATNDPREAHAEVEVGGRALRAGETDRVVLR